ncbi:Cuticular protein RR-1 motif 19, partial [Operophtera brumata]
MLSSPVPTLSSLLSPLSSPPQQQARWIKAQEAGQVTGHESGTEAHGAYSYTGDDGQLYTVTYTADEN